MALPEMLTALKASRIQMEFTRLPLRHRAFNPSVVNLGQRRRKVLRDAPLWIMRQHLGQVRNVADVIAASGRIYILVFHPFARDFAYGFEGFQDGNGVLSPASDVVNFCWARSRDEAFDESGDIDTMNVITNLFSFVAKDPISSLFNVAMYQITQEAMELYPAVIWSGQASA